MESKRSKSNIGMGFLLGAAVGVGYAAWTTSKSKTEVKRLVRHHLGEIVEQLPEMIEEWMEKNWSEDMTHSPARTERVIDDGGNRNGEADRKRERKVALWRRMWGR